MTRHPGTKAVFRPIRAPVRIEKLSTSGRGKPRLMPRQSSRNIAEEIGPLVEPPVGIRID
jgi:hypothetical protein